MFQMFKGETAIFFGTLFIILSSITLASIILMKLKRDKDLFELKERIKSWWGMAIIFCITTLFNPTISLFTLGILCFLALREFFSLIQTNRLEQFIYFWAYLSIPFQLYWIHIEWYGMFIIFIPIYVFLFLPFMLILTGKTKGFVSNIGTIQWGLMLMVFGLTHMAYITKLSPETGGLLILYLVVLTQVNDVIQFLWTKFIGGKTLFPKLNTNTTFGGIMISLFSTLLVSYFIYPIFTPMSLKFALISSFLISFTGTIGRLTIATVKLDLNFKKKNSTLNKIDSLSYTAPIFFHFIRYFFF